MWRDQALETPPKRTTPRNVVSKAASRHGAIKLTGNSAQSTHERRASRRHRRRAPRRADLDKIHSLSTSLLAMSSAGLLPKGAQGRLLQRTTRLLLLHNSAQPYQIFSTVSLVFTCPLKGQSSGQCYAPSHARTHGQRHQTTEHAFTIGATSTHQQLDVAMLQPAQQAARLQTGSHFVTEAMHVPGLLGLRLARCKSNLIMHNIPQTSSAACCAKHYC